MLDKLNKEKQIMKVEEWFRWYIAQVGKDKNWATYRDKYLCPCCFMPTLDSRADYDICTICFWEDDGQDTDDAADIRGGPNGNYSLSEARENFEKYHTMYRPSDSVHFERETSANEYKVKLYQAFCKAIKSTSDIDWKIALDLHQEYYNNDEDEI